VKIRIGADLYYSEADHAKAMTLGADTLQALVTATDAVLAERGFKPNRIDLPSPESQWPGDYKPPRDTLHVEIEF